MVDVARPTERISDDSGDEPPERADGASAASVLVVDDHADVREATGALLTLMGFRVFCADCGEAALQVLRKAPDIEVLLTDVVMPRMDGLALARQAKKVAPRIRIVLMSGYAQPCLHASIARSHFPVLAKPFKAPDLARAIG